MNRDNSHERSEPKSPWEIKAISAVTLATHDMTRAVRFYRALGFTLRTGGERSLFTSLNAGSSYVNIILQPSERPWSWWG